MQAGRIRRQMNISYSQRYPLPQTPRTSAFVRDQQLKIKKKPHYRLKRTNALPLAS